MTHSRKERMKRRDRTLKGLIWRETRGSVVCQRTVQRVQGQGENELPEGSWQTEHRTGQGGTREPEKERKRESGRRTSGGDTGRVTWDRYEKEMRGKEETAGDRGEGRRTDRRGLSGASRRAKTERVERNEARKNEEEVKEERKTDGRVCEDR